MEAWHCCLLHTWLWLSLTHLDGGLTLLFVAHMVVVVPDSPWWRPDTAVCCTHGCGCPWLTLMEAWHCCLLHIWLWLSLTHLDGGLTLLFVAHMVMVVPGSPWWRPDTAVCYTGCCGCPWLTLMEAWHCCLLHMVVVVPDSPWWRPDTAVCYTRGCGCLWLTLMEAWHCCLLHMVVVVPDSPWWRPDTAVCYTHGCGCLWLTLMEAWHCCLLQTWLWLSQTQELIRAESRSLQEVSRSQAVKILKHVLSAK